MVGERRVRIYSTRYSALFLARPILQHISRVPTSGRAYVFVRLVLCPATCLTEPEPYALPATNGVRVVVVP